MSISENYRSLVAHLSSKKDVLAALVIDQEGSLLASEGEAQSVRSLPDPTLTKADLNTLERAYVIPEGDVFVVVVFKEATQFEQISGVVSQTIEEVMTA
jgi:hypothetical protein